MACPLGTVFIATTCLGYKNKHVVAPGKLIAYTIRLLLSSLPINVLYIVDLRFYVCILFY